MRSRAVNDVSVKGRGVKATRTGNAVMVEVQETREMIGRGVLVFVHAHVSDTYGTSPYPAGEGGFYYGSIVRDFGRESVEGFVGDWYSSQGTSKPGSGTYTNALGGALWDTIGVSGYDCIVANVEEFGVIQSRMLNISNKSYPVQDAVWVGVVIGYTKADDARPSLPMVYIKGAAEFPCTVELTSRHDDTEIGDIAKAGYYKGKMRPGTFSLNESAAFYDPLGGGSYENALVVNLPERRWSNIGEDPWLDPALLPLVPGNRIGFVQRNGSAVDGFHVVYISETGLRPATTTIADIPNSPTPTASDVANKVNALLAALRASGIIPT